MPTAASLNKRRFIRRSDPKPVYLQVAALLEKSMLQASSAAERTALPSENVLAEEFGVSRVTIRQALDELHFKGLIYREKGRGSFARSNHISGVTGFGSFTAEVENGGGVPSSKFLSFRQVTKLPLGLMGHLTKIPEPSEGYYCLSRVRCVDGLPVAREDSYLPQALYPGITQDDVATGSLYSAMSNSWGLKPAWADAAIEPDVADEDSAKLLGIKMGAPVVVAWRVTSSEQDEILEFVRSIYRGEGFALTVRRHKIG